MRKSLLVVAITWAFLTTTVQAQIQLELEAEKQGFRNGVQWVKRTWYNPLPGTTEPDLSSIPNIYLRPNQLIEYSKEGKLKSETDFEGGTDDKTLSTERYIWKDGRLMQKVQENADYEVLSSTTYTYDAEGRVIKADSKAGPGDKMGFFAGLATVDETTWEGNGKKTVTTRDRSGNLITTTAITLDAAGRTMREDYPPGGLYSARTYSYDAKGALLKNVYLGKDGQPSSIWTFENNSDGKPVKRAMQHFYQGKKDSEEITSYTYNAQGDKIGEKTVKDGKTTSDYSWQHKYDAKGNRIQTAHIKAGKPEYIEVLKLLYYRQ